MGEQRNLTEGNVEELRTMLDKMKKDNPDLEYRFFKQAEQPMGPTVHRQPTNQELMDKLDHLETMIDALSRNINHVFDGHVLISGTWMKVKP